MDSLRALVEQYARAAWRRRWLGVFITWLICGVGWVGVYLVPDQYESSARLFVDADAILTPLLHGLAADSGPTSQLEMLQRTLLSRPNLEKLVSKTDLDLSVANPSDRERLLQSLGQDIKVIPQTRNLFTITYRNKSAKLAHDVVQTLLSIFVESATGSNRIDMENAKRFLEHQISSYEQQLRAAEKRRADFHTKYVEILPAGLNADAPYAMATEGVRNTVQDIDGKLQDAVTKRDTLREELAKTPAMLVAEDNTQLQAQVKTKLQEAQEQLKMMLLRDTEQHPEVIAQKKLIEALKTSREGAGPVAGNGKGDDAAAANAGKRSVSNPVYEQLKVKLVDAETALASLQRQRAREAELLDRVEKVQREQPGLWAEYQNMDRDYGVLRKNYEELLGRLQAANIAQAADTQADKVKLQVVDPPETPRLPAAPNRLLLVSGVLVAGLGGGLAFTILLSQLDRSFSTVDQLRNLGLPVVGGISILGLPPLVHRLLVAARFSVAVVALVGVYGGLMVHILRVAALI
ncbi:MAG TPA: XrtA system polysaccharide chain length determinant [Acetobacteraceae bacterium]|nr:XrtA system polysaccharide chain length determinant [Acetobacteraceae bacterium]